MLYGFVFKRSKGSHHLYYNPVSEKTVIVPVHGNKDIPKGIFFQSLNKPVLIKVNYEI